MTIDSFNYSPRGIRLLLSSNKPQGLAAWKETFARWQLPESNSESNRIETAKRKVTDAIKSANMPFLRGKQLTLIPQGSWHNRTNVRLDSDLDICVCLEGAFFNSCLNGPDPQLHETGHVPLSFTFDEFKTSVFHALANKSFKSVKLQQKSIQLITSDTSDISVDVVPTFRFNYYQKNQIASGYKLEHTGVGLLASDGTVLSNFPEQHHANGKIFHEATSRRYKKVVRIVKRLRNHMRDNMGASMPARSSATNMTSFAIESLIYNCPVECFGNQQIYDDVISVLNFLKSSLGSNALLIPKSRLRGLLEVNEIKPLFGAHQKATDVGSLRFVTEALIYIEC